MCKDVLKQNKITLNLSKDKYLVPCQYECVKLRSEDNF